MNQIYHHIYTKELKGEDKINNEIISKIKKFLLVTTPFKVWFALEF